MSITSQQSKTNNGTSTTPSLTFDTAPSEGDLIVIMVNVAAQDDHPSSTSGMVLAESPAAVEAFVADQARNIGVWVKVAGASEGAEFNFSLADSRQWTTIGRVLTGQAANDYIGAVNITSEGGLSGDTIPIPEITPEGGSFVWGGVYSSVSISSWPSPWADVLTANRFGAPTAGTATKESDGTATGGVVTLSDDTTRRSAVIVEFVAGAAAATPGVRSGILKVGGAAQTNLTNVEVQIVGGTALNGTELYYSAAQTTDGDGRIPDIELAGSEVNDNVVVKVKTAAGESINVATSVIDLDAE